MNSKTVLKKRKLYLIAFVITLLVFIGIFYLTTSKIKDYNDLTLVNLLVAIVLVVVMARFRTTLYAYNNMARTAKLIELQNSPVSFKYNLVEDRTRLLTLGYELFTKTPKFEFYTKYVLDESRKRSKVWRLSYTVVVFDNNMDFYSNEINEMIHKFEDQLDKKKMPKYYEILVYKAYPNGIPESETSMIGEIVNYYVKNVHFCQINIGLDLVSDKAYYLYSKQYSPSYNYKIAVKTIENQIL